MKDLGKVKERYEFSFDARQLGLVLMAVAAIAAIVFALGVSVGVQWELKKSDETRRPAVAAAGRPAPKTQGPSTLAVPAAPPVLAPVTTARARLDKAVSKAPPVSLTFPKVLTSNTRNTAPLVPGKKAEARGRKYTVQAGAYSEKGAAKARADRLRKKGYDARVYNAGGKKGYSYKVRVGSFPTRAEAAAVAKKLQANEKVSPYITLEEAQEVGR